MEITLRRGGPADVEECCRVEALATPKLLYLKDAAEYYFDETRGDLTCAFAGDKLAGFGKLSLLCDGSAWLEALRVDPEFQGMGVGKALYGRFLEEAAELGATAARMYTGVANRVSAGLAARMGFKQVYRGRGMRRGLPETKAALPQGFVRAEPDRACALLVPLAPVYGGFLSLNRTFYALNDQNCRGMAQKGWVWEHPQSGSVAVMGARFLPRRALHIALCEGDVGLCLRLAEHLARRQEAATLEAMFADAYLGLERRLSESGFSAAGDCIVMERRTG